MKCLTVEVKKKQDLDPLGQTSCQAYGVTNTTWTVNHLQYHQAQLPFWLAIGLSHPGWTNHKATQVLTHYRI